MPIERKGSSKNVIELKWNGKIKNDLGEEGYKLDVEKQGIRLFANTTEGLFRGTQSLWQLMPPSFHANKANTNTIWTVPVVAITDKPRFAWRGMLLDCSRHFMTKDFVKRYIDLLAFYKMNTLHWHITEDQGWRLEIKKYPKLTEIGAWRTEKDGTRYGGYYTQEDVKEIVAYAESRFITVVPEIELPGHSQAALAAYPEISCTGGPFEVETEWGVFKEIYCAGNEQTFTFLEDVLSEVVELFPSEYVHIGGDEAPKYRWEHCPKCQKRIKTEGLHDEHELQSYFISRVAQFLATKNRKIIGWDEILEGGLPKGATVQSWRGMDGAIQAAKQGHYAIVSPTSHAYFDYDVKAIDVQKVYSFEPVPKSLNVQETQYIMGGECNMWTERAPQDKVDSKVFPRILAMSEVLWTEKNIRDFDIFYKNMQLHYEILDNLGVTYGFETVPIALQTKLDANKNLLFTIIAGGRALDIHYTLDGSRPTQSSPKYEKTIRLTESTTLKVQAFKNKQVYGDMFERTYVAHQANGIVPKLDYLYSPSYTGGGDDGLTDGLRGTLDFRDGLWQGFQKNDLIAIIDLGENRPISEIRTGYYQYNNSWIFLPTKVHYYVSDDGENFKKMATVPNSTSPKQSGQFKEDFVTQFSTTARYVKVVAENIEICPDWHDASGSHAWLFVDEIIVR